MEWFADITPLLTVGILTALAAGLGAGLGVAACAFRVEEDPVVERINELLPQTQCGQCGYPGCLPYARAVAAGEAINKCPPGGASTVNALAGLLGTEPVPLDPAHGTEQQPTVAFIREAECIGCAKCLQACPVDAIVGAPQRMHTVIASECTGCDLCLDPCPVDCIDMLPVSDPEQAWQWPLPGEASGPHQNLIASDRPTGVSPP